MKEQNVEQALQDIEQAIARDPELIPAYSVRALIRLRQGSVKEGIEDLDRFLAESPEDAGALLQRAQAWMQLQEFDQARQDFDAVIEMCPSLAAAYSGRGYAWIQMGEQEKATADFREAITCEPAQADEFELHRLLAQAAYCHAQEEFGDAIRMASEAMELSEDNRFALGVRGAAIASLTVQSATFAASVRLAIPSCSDASGCSKWMP